MAIRWLTHVKYDNLPTYLSKTPRYLIYFDGKLNGKRLYPSTNIKYLGVLLDEHLSWKPYINELTKKLNRSNSMLSKVRHYVNCNTIRSLYFALFSSHISYCCQVWGQNGNPHLNRILSIQRSALRIINFKTFRSNVSLVFRSLNIPLFSNLVRVSNLLFVFDSLSNSLPVSISNFFTHSRDTHTYNTRHSKNGKLFLPKFKSVKYGKNGIKYQCTAEWNKSITAISKVFQSKYANSFYYKNIFDLNRNQFKDIIQKYIYLS